MSNRTIILAAATGVLAGAAAALLLAPSSGKETRKKLSRSAEDAKRSMEDFFQVLDQQLGRWCGKTEESRTPETATKDK
jgi:gas vesicle protein